MTLVVEALAVDTALGVVGLEVSEAGLRRVRLPGEGRTSAARSRVADGLGKPAAEQISAYAAGEREEFDLLLDWAAVDSTHRRVLETLREIAPYGATVTYGELGRQSGVDDPREIGVFMATNPLPLVVPCHRVVASDGLGGFGGGLELKQRLLELEGALPPRLDLGL